MKKIGLLTLIILLGGISWYLFIKKYDYQITFRANAAPGSVYDQVLHLRSAKNREENMTQTIEKVPFTQIKQEVILGEEPVVLDWSFSSVADTITQIQVGIISKNHSIKNRMQILTGSTALVDAVKDDLISFRKKLNYYTDSFRVIVEGEDQIADMEVLSVSSKTKRYNKATEMMRNNAYLYPKLKESHVKQKGFPFVEINNWNIKTDSIYMNFGFPIVFKDSLPVNEKLKYRTISKQKALKATYYGNYRNSDEAWFVLLAYATKNNIPVEDKLLEVFYNNPMQGGNEIEWRAEIFLPIKE